MSSARRRVAIAGGRGYGGAELLRWLATHPEFDVVGVSSRSLVGRTVADVHPQLGGFYDELRFVEQPVDLLDAGTDAVLLALPHRHAAEHAAALLERAPELCFVDLSGDHRLDDPAAYQRHYRAEHPFPDVLRSGSWTYGFTEAHREELTGARLIANPGCFATGALLGVSPLARAGLVAGPVRHVAITGSSGSGADAKAGTHHPERVENVRAYKVLAHQHVPEVLRDLGLDPDHPWRMVPQSGPFARGIFSTLFVPTSEALGQERLEELFDEAYADARLVRRRSGTPQLGDVRNTAFADLSVQATGAREVVVLTAIDNLAKGMATQAIQNLNLAFGLDDTTGLLRPGGRP